MDEVELYQSADGTVTLDVKTDGDTVWLTQAQMSTLFGRDRTVIVRHIANAEREELAGVRTRAKYAQVQIEGDRSVHRDLLTGNDLGDRIIGNGSRFRGHFQLGNLCADR